VTIEQSTKRTQIDVVRRRLGHLAHQRLTDQLDPAEAQVYEDLCALERSLIDAGAVR
jgi:hypothetical protein